MAPKYRIALIQLYPKPLDPDHNFQKASTFIRSASESGAHLAVLPEYHLTNWLPSDPQFAPLCASWRKYLEAYQHLAASLRINIVPGTIVQLIQDPADSDSKILINVAYFISDKGEILGSYQKKNLWHPERPHLTSSKHSPHETIQTPLGPVGLLICWDLAFPEAFRELIAYGAKIIIIPTFWTLADCSPYGLSKNPLSEKLFLESTLAARAFENTCAVVFVNAGADLGEGEKGDYAGMSRVTVPFVGEVGGDAGKETGGERGMWREEGVRIVEVDMKDVEEGEKNYKVREDLAGDGWHYTYRHQERKG